MRAIDADAVPQEFWEYEFDGKWRGCTIKDLLDSQPTIHPEPHWIPVTERLPEEEGEYLVTSVYQYYRDGRKTYKTTVDRWSRNGAGKEWVATSNDAHIAWMPLPEPYKEVTE